MFWFLGFETCRTLFPWPGIEHIWPALEGEVLTTRLSGKSPKPMILKYEQPSLTSPVYWQACFLPLAPPGVFTKTGCRLSRVTWFGWPGSPGPGKRLQPVWEASCFWAVVIAPRWGSWRVSRRGDSWISLGDWQLGSDQAGPETGFIRRW